MLLPFGARLSRSSVESASASTSSQPLRSGSGLAPYASRPCGGGVGRHGHRATTRARPANPTRRPGRAVAPAWARGRRSSVHRGDRPARPDLSRTTGPRSKCWFHGGSQPVRELLSLGHAHDSSPPGGSGTRPPSRCSRPLNQMSPNRVRRPDRRRVRRSSAHRRCDHCRRGCSRAARIVDLRAATRRCDG